MLDALNGNISLLMVPVYRVTVTSDVVALSQRLKSILEHKLK